MPTWVTIPNAITAALLVAALAIAMLHPGCEGALPGQLVQWSDAGCRVLVGGQWVPTGRSVP